MCTTLLLANHFSVLKFWTSPFQAQTAFPHVRFDGRCWGHTCMDKYTVMSSGSCSIMDKISWLLKCRATLMVWLQISTESHTKVQWNTIFTVKQPILCLCVHLLYLCACIHVQTAWIQSAIVHVSQGGCLWL